MAVTQIDFGTSTSIIAATSTTGTAPTSSTDGYKLASLSGVGVRGYAPSILTYLDYTGTVSSGTLRLYLRKGNGAWFKGDSFAMTGTDEVFVWAVGAKEFYFVVEAISGGGTVQVSAEGAQS